MTNKLMRMPWGKIVLFSIVFCFLAIIKLHNYDRFPGPAHGEELLYSWSGINLIETGVPVSWSTLDYPKKYLVFDGIVGDKNNLYMPATLWRPWLDEPPLYSLLSGGASHLYGDDREKVIPASRSRIPSVFASLITTVLVFFVGFKFFDFTTGMLAMSFYGLSPVLVLGARLSVPENIIAMVGVGCLLLARSYMHKPRVLIAITFGAMAAVLGLMKPTGFFLAPLMIFLAASKKRWRDIFVIILITLLGIGAYAAYGYYYDWELFKHIVSIQGQRYAGWSGLGYIFTSPAYDIFLTFDGWYIFGLIMSLYYCLNKKKSLEIRLLCLFFFYWLMVCVFSGTEQDLLPWYRYPLFPLIAIFGGLGIKKMIKSADFYSVAFSLGLLMSSRYFMMNAFRPTTPTSTFRFVYLLAMIPSLVYMAWKFKVARQISRIILVVFIVMGMWYNAKYIYSIFEIRCESISCPFGPSTVFSEVKMPYFWRWLVVGDSTDMLTTKRPKF